MKSIFLISALSLLAVSAIGVGVGLQANNKAEKVEATTYTGSIIVQKDDSDMRYTGSKLVAYFFDDESGTGWGEAIANTDTKYQEYTWSLEFDPTKIIMLRVDAENWKANDPWNNVWSRTGNVTLSGTDVIWMNGSAAEGNEGTGWGTYSTDVTISGGTSDNWSEDIVNTKLSSRKFSNDMEKLEVYGLVTIPANTYFKAHKASGDSWHNVYDAEDSLKSRFSIVESDKANILDTVGGTYEIYFKFDESNALWITDPISAAADEWAQEFLGSGANACNATTKANWGTLADDYEDLATSYGSAFTTIFTSEVHADHEDEVVGYIKLAVQRYDYVLQRYSINAANDDEHGYEDFMLRAGKIPSGEIRTISSETATTNNTTMIIVLASVVTLAAVGGYFLLRKRED